MTDTRITITAWGETYVVTPVIGKYANGRLAIALEEPGGFPFAKVTVNMPNDHLNDGEFFVRDWSENGPIVSKLIAEGWLVRTGREVPSGHVVAPVMRAAGVLAELIEKAV